MRLATLQEYVRILKPSVVVWFYSENDLADLKNEKRHPALMAYLKRGIDQDLITRQTEIDHALSAYVDSETGQSEISRKLKEMTDVMTAVIADRGAYRQWSTGG